MRAKLFSVLLLLLSAHAALPAAAAELIMFEEPGCVWCHRWHAEIGTGYPNSEEGMVAPLRRVDLRDGVPSDVKVERVVTMTPTFVLVDGGQERGRIVGYPGAHFFYPMLAELLKKLLPAEPKGRLPAQRDARNSEATVTR